MKPNLRKWVWRSVREFDPHTGGSFRGLISLRQFPSVYLLLLPIDQTHFTFYPAASGPIYRSVRRIVNSRKLMS